MHCNLVSVVSALSYGQLEEERRYLENVLQEVPLISTGSVSRPITGDMALRRNDTARH
jgi:hypothetical protein